MLIRGPLFGPSGIAHTHINLHKSFPSGWLIKQQLHGAAEARWRETSCNYLCRRFRVECLSFYGWLGAHDARKRSGAKGFACLPPNTRTINILRSFIGAPEKYKNEHVRASPYTEREKGWRKTRKRSKKKSQTCAN